MFIAHSSQFLSLCVFSSYRASQGVTGPVSTKPSCKKNSRQRTRRQLVLQDSSETENQSEDSNMSGEECPEFQCQMKGKSESRVEAQYITLLVVILSLFKMDK